MNNEKPANLHMQNGIAPLELQGLKLKPLPQNLWVIIASFHANHRVFIGYELKKLVSNLTVEFCECRQLEKYGIATDLETQLDET